MGAAMGFYQPVTYVGTFFVGAAGFLLAFEQRHLRQRGGGRGVRTELFQGGLDLGWAIGKIGELRVGYDGGRARFNRRIGSPSLPDVDADTGAIIARVTFDQLDKIADLTAASTPARSTPRRWRASARPSPSTSSRLGVYIPKTFGRRSPGLVGPWSYAQIP